MPLSLSGNIFLRNRVSGQCLVPKSNDSGTAGSITHAIIINAILPGLFAAQFEERGHVALHGHSYRENRRITPMLTPFTKRAGCPITAPRIETIRAATAK